MADVTFRLELLNQSLKRHVLMGVRIQRMLSHLLQQAIEVEVEVNLSSIRCTPGVR